MKTSMMTSTMIITTPAARAAHVCLFSTIPSSPDKNTTANPYIDQALTSSKTSIIHIQHVKALSHETHLGSESGGGMTADMQISQGPALLFDLEAMAAVNCMNSSY